MLSKIVQAIKPARESSVATAMKFPGSNWKLLRDDIIVILLERSTMLFKEFKH